MSRHASTIAQEARLGALNALSRERALTDAESAELVELLRLQKVRSRNQVRALRRARAKVKRFTTKRWQIDQQLAAARARVAQLQTESRA